MLRSLVKFAAIASIAGLAAANVPAWATSFTVNPSAVGEPGAPFTTTFLDYSYVALVDQTATAGSGTFTIEGAGFFSSFRHPDLATPAPGAVDISSGAAPFRLYATFTGSGTVAPSADSPGGLTATYTGFQLQMFVDRDANTTILADGTGPPNGTVSVSGTADDTLVATSTGLISGEAHIFPGLANGDFDVVVAFEPVGGFLSGPFITGLNVADFNGVNTSISGVTMNSFTDGRIDGSGNLSVSVIPEPTTLLLIGTGLAGLGLLQRRRAVRLY